MLITRLTREIAVNGGQRDPRTPVVTALANQEWAVAWVATSPTESMHTDVYARVIPEFGDSRTTLMLTVENAAGSQRAPAITASGDSSGRAFVVAYEDRVPYLGNASNTWIASYDIDGHLLERLLGNAAGTSAASVVPDHEAPSVITLNNGNIVVVWQGFTDPLTTTDRDIFLSAFSPSGERIITDQPVVTTAEGLQRAPSVTSLSNGNFVVVWQDESKSGQAEGRDVRGQIFSPDGVPIGEEILINHQTVNDQFQPDVAALPGGGFVVTWLDRSGLNGDISGDAIAARIFDQNGVASTPIDLLVNTITTGTQTNAKVASFAGGGFIVTWQDNSGVSPIGTEFGTDSSGFGIKAQVFTSAGLKVGQEFLVNDTNRSGDQLAPDVATQADGQFFITWQSATRAGEPAGGSWIQGSIWRVDLSQLSSAPIITSNGGGDLASAALPENTDTVTTVTAIDDPGVSLVFSIAGGADAAVFGIESDTGRLFFLTSPDFEAPSDANQDNVYEVTVAADNGNESDTQTIAVRVTNVAEALVLTGTAGDDSLTGGSEGDLLDGLAGNDTLNGGDGDDTLLGGDGNDIVSGNGGDDLLDGGAGADVMSGGSGNDIYYVDNAGDQVIEDIFMKEPGAEPAGGNDLVYASVSYVLGTNVEQLVLTGSGNINGTGNALANQITGNAGNNRLDGGAGNDSLAGGLGNDTYVVDSSSDVVTEAAAAGIDLVEASASFVLGDNLENLTLTGAGNIDGTGNAIGNRIVGNAGNNVLNGAAGADVLQGLGGNDSYIVDNVNDRVIETLSQTVGDTNDAGGVDTVFASVSYSLDTASNIRFVENLTLTGAANINATGNALANVIAGNSGNNILDGGAGNDSMAGGAGNDIYLVDAAGDVVTEDASAGSDAVRASVSYTLAANVENLELQGSANLNGIGNGDNNAITGNSGNNRLEGLGGNDVLNGGAGADSMLGGAGDDSYVIDNGSDRVFETVTSNAADTNDAGGIDTVSTSITINMNGYNGIRYVERAVLTGTASIGITGNALANHITGNSGNNSIDGGEGADTMIGGRGNDIYTVDNAGDVVTEVVGQGFDTVRSSISYTLGSEVEDLVLTGSADLTGTGNGLANRLTGNAGNNILDGGGGTDTLIGGAGNDTYIFDNPGDRAFETVTATATDTNDAGGRDQILSPFSIYLAQTNGMRFIENATLTGSAAAAVYGNDLGNAITANSGANYLDGANGNDIILGMGGNDTMLGGAGADTLDGGAGRDRLTGGAGQDILTGGAEADTFVFATGDMGTSQGTADRITDWSGLAGGQGDRIDLSAIDANTANGSGTNEAFAFIGSGAFTNVAGQLRSEVIGGNTYLMADTNGDGIADLWLQLDGTVNVGLGDLGL